MRNLLLLYTLAATLTGNDGQMFSIDCPEGWILYQSNCYFFSDTKLVFEEADATCWSYGSKLVSVESSQENKFISDWLQKSDTFARKTIYFTSGKSMMSTQSSQYLIFWEGVNENHVGSPFWVGIPPNGARTYRIAYMYTDHGYGWTGVSSNSIGGFICEIPKSLVQDPNILKRDFGYGIGTYDPNKVKQGPVILQQPESTIVFETVNQVHVECVANGNPAPTYTVWKGLSPSSSVQVLPTERYTLSGGRMTIQDPKEREDENYYYMLVTNEVGTVISEIAQVTFGYLGSFPNIELEPVVATAFKGAKMECNEPSFSPRVTFHWFKNSATGIHVWEGAANFFVSYSGTMYISEVQPTDAGKKYFCVVSLAPTEGAQLGEGLVPSRTSLGQWLYLSEEQGSSDNDYAPVVHTHTFPTNPMVGKRVRLECIAYGRLPLSYSWSREDGQPFVPGTAFSDRNRVVYINNASLTAEGNYVCKVRTGSGQIASGTVVLTMNAKPYFPFPIGNRLVDSGMSLKWFCRAVGRPAPYYSWYKDGKLLTSVPAHLTIDGGELTLIKIDPARDEGMYQCAATNTYGTTFSSGQLKVLTIKPNFERFPLKETTYAAIGSNITIPCTVEAAPLPEVNWFRNGANLNIVRGELNGRIGMSISYTLVISSVEYSDAGEYTCKATNDQGEAADSTRLIVADAITLTNAPTSFTALVNTTAFFACEAAYNPIYDVAYIWKFNGKPVNFKFSKEFALGTRYNINGLYIVHTQFKHAGIYECEARTPLHSISRSAYLTVEGPPAAPAGLYIDYDSITSRSVLLIWTNVEKQDRGGIATHYDIEADTTFRPDDWKPVALDIPDHIATADAMKLGLRHDQKAYNITNLVPNNSYRFRVRPINQFGRGPEASLPSVIVKVSASKPVEAPRNVDGGGGTVGTLTITWDPLDESEYCGPGLGYYIYWKRPEDTKDWKREIGMDEMALNGGKYVVTVGVDNYYLPYKVMVGAFNALGMGPNSSEVTIFSAEGMPVAVPVALDAEGFNGTSIIVYWQPVPDTREAIFGRVRGYRVYYYANEHGETPFEGHEPDPIVNEILFKDVYGQTDHCQLIGLHMNTEYFSRVQVFNGAGFGPKGEWRRSETANDMISDQPIFVSVYHRNSHSVIVRWRGITNYKYSESSLLGYKVRIWKVQEDIRTAKDTVVDKVTETVVDGLQTRTVYVVRVLGFSGSGDGSLSQAVYFTITDNKVINIPLDPTTSEMCFSTEDGRTCGALQLIVNQSTMLVVIINVLFLTKMLS